MLKLYPGSQKIFNIMLQAINKIAIYCNKLSPVFYWLKMLMDTKGVNVKGLLLGISTTSWEFYNRTMLPKC